MQMRLSSASSCISWTRTANAMLLKQNGLRLELDSVPDGLVGTCWHLPDFVTVAASITQPNTNSGWQFDCLSLL